METVDDIIKEIRQIAHNISVADEKTLSMFRPAASFAWFADRLDAAYKRRIKAVVELNEMNMNTVMDEVTRLRYENERLKALVKNARRNCDLFKTYHDAVDAWWEMDINKRLNYRYNMSEWLFDEIENGGAK